MTSDPILKNNFSIEPEETERIETGYRKIVTALPAPETLDTLKRSALVYPRVNCYQAPIVWDRADGFQVFDFAGNCWIDFSSTAVMTNTGHGHPAIRAAVAEHASQDGLMAQFSFASEIRLQLAERLLELAPPGCEKVYFWTVGSEANECAFRLVRERGMKQDPEKYRILTFAGDYHGWTLAAHQLSGASAGKNWLSNPDSAIHHLPFPVLAEGQPETEENWNQLFSDHIKHLEQSGISPKHIAGVFIESFQGWGALPFPKAYIQRLRRWADENDSLIIFDEVQTGFGRTGKMFAHEHYEVQADLISIGKGVSSTLPIAALLGPADVLDLLSPGEITTTHAAHPLSCAAALANLDVLKKENLIAEAKRKGEIARAELDKLQSKFPHHVSRITGTGLVFAIHLMDSKTREPDMALARDLTWETIKRGVMLFYTNRPTIKICPPLIISDDAIVEGISAIGDALANLVSHQGES